MLVTSIFSFSQNVFKRLLSKGRLKLGLCGKGLKVNALIFRVKDDSYNYGDFDEDEEGVDDVCNEKEDPVDKILKPVTKLSTVAEEDTQRPNM